MAVQNLSHYEILEQIAEGGMGVVYKARDIKLDRLVALKLLSPNLTASSEEVGRLFDEARALSRLNHPNVATIYEVEDGADKPFMALEYLPGGTLRGKIRKSRNNGDGLSAKAVIDYARQIARGLAHAHRHGIIHRDVKTDNVLLTAEGTVKITDFGVALVAGHRASRPGEGATGTAAYMSPEQAQGLVIDHRSDIFSFGVVLFELATGGVPYAGQPSEAMLYDIVNTPAPSIHRYRDDLPVSFERLVNKALAKDPNRRYAEMDEVLAHLERIRNELNIETTRIHPVQPPEPTIAVLPFVDMSPQRDQEYFCDGITEEIISALTSVKGLKVVSRTSSFQFKGEAYDVRKVGEQLGVQTILEGSVRKLGHRFRITAQHINVADGYHLWSQRFDREMEDVFAVQDEISQAIVENLRLKLVGGRRPQIVKKRTENVEAYNQYLQGRYHLNRRSYGDILKAIECFEQSNCEDCHFAYPLAGLCEAYLLLGYGGYPEPDPAGALEKAKQAALQAVGIDESSSDAHTALALVYFRKDWNWAGAEKEFRRAIELNDGYATAHHQFAMFLAAVNRLDEAELEIRWAHELDPLAPIIGTALGRILHFRRRYDEAIEQIQRTIELHPRFSGAYFDLGVSYSQKDLHQQALEAFRKLREFGGDQVAGLMTLAMSYTRMGNPEKAQIHLDELDRLGETRHLAPSPRAILEIVRGNLDLALDYLDEAYAQHAPALVYVQCEPLFDPIRTHPRYAALIRRIGFPQIAAAQGQPSA